MGIPTLFVDRRSSGNDDGSARQKLTVAGLEVDSKLLRRFAESFKLFNFDVRLIEIQSPHTRQAGAITACVLPLIQSAVACLRKSAWFSPRRTMLYGIGNWNDAARFSDLGINALLEKTSGLSFQNAISSTHTLIGRGIGAHARVPIVTAVTINVAGVATKGITRNLGPGGMAVTLSKNLSLPDKLKIEFSLPGAEHLSFWGTPRWYSGLLVGLSFEPSQNIKTLRQWTSAYSQLGKQT